jgi:hypothetical protein
LFIFLSLAIAGAAFAAKPVASEPMNIGDANISASAIQWQASGAYERLTLTVSGPDGYSFSKEFTGATMPALRVQDLGAKVADGSYTWELRAAPRVSAETRNKLAQARQSGDDQAAARIQAEAGLDHAVMQSGAFIIMNSAFVSNKGEETPGTGGTRKITTNALKPAPEDQVYADDVIIQGSACIGLDCVNNESFGFDTIRLKENNTRIKFDDTSTGTGFPNHDWQLTANDSASGGANKFSIEDITASTVPVTVTGSAPTNSIFVDSTGRVGFRTSTPVLDLHVNTSNTPAMRLEQNNSGGFSAQTWDVAGNEANFFVRDVTGGSRLPFRIRPGAPTSSIDINASGKVGVGTASPSEQLHVLGSTNVRAFIVDSNNTTSGVNMEVDSGGSSVGFGVVRTENNGDMDFFTGASGGTLGERLRIRSAGNIGIACNAPGSKLVVASGSGCANPSSSMNPGDAQFTVASSRTFKEHIAPLQMPDILDRISSVGVYNYDYINGPKDRIGLIAEDFHKVFGRGDEKYINGGEVQVALWLAVQQLSAENQTLKDRLNALESKVETVK